MGWTIRKVVHPTGSNRLVDNPEVEETTMNLVSHNGNDYPHIIPKHWRFDISKLK